MDTPSVQSLGLTQLLLYAHTALWIELATEVLSLQLPWIKQSCPYPQKNSFTSIWGSSEKDLKIPVYGPNNENILLQVIYKDSPLWWERAGSWEGGLKNKWKGKKERNMDLRSQWHRANQAGTTWKQTKSIVEHLETVGFDGNSETFRDSSPLFKTVLTWPPPASRFRRAVCNVTATRLPVQFSLLRVLQVYWR